MPRNLQKKLTWYLFVASLCACPYVYAQSQAPKITKIKLADYGWQPVSARTDSFEHKILSNLWLDHQGRILVGFTVRENYELTTRERPGRTLHILRFTADGKQDLSLGLPTNNWYSNGFYLGPDDGIFALANDAFQWLSGGENDQNAAWQTLARCPAGECYVNQSFSRQTLILRVGGRIDRSTYTIVDASSSPPRATKTCSQMASMKITDQFSYRTNYDRDDDLTVRYPFCEVDHYEDFPMWGRGGGYILNDETLLQVFPNGARLLGADGQTRFFKSMPKHDYIDYFRIATDERLDRFALSVYTVRGEHPRLDIGGHLVARRVLVLDATGKELASIPTETHYQMDTNFSLSPDGHRLAILDEGVVTVVDLE
jgi:hypothetical protein